MLGQWNVSRYLAWDLQDYAINSVAGQKSYSVGVGGDFNIPREAQMRLEKK